MSVKPVAKVAKIFGESHCWPKRLTSIANRKMNFDGPLASRCQLVCQSKHRSVFAPDR